MVAWTGIEIAALHGAMCLSGRAFCRRVGVSERMFYEWLELGTDTKLRPTTRAIFEKALAQLSPDERTRFELGVGGQTTGAEVRCVESDTPEVDVNRKNFLRGLMVGPPALAIAAPTLLALWEREQSEIERMAYVRAAPNRVDAQTVSNIRGALKVAQKMDDDAGPSEAVVAVRGIADTTHWFLRNTSDPIVLAGLKQQLAPIYTSMGWQLFDLKRFQEATHAYSEARDAADEVKDETAGAMVMAEWGVCDSEIYSPAAALDKCVAAEARAARAPYDPNLRAHTASLVARGAAKIGDAAGCRVAVRRAYGYNVQDVEPETSPAYFCNPSHVSYQVARAFQSIGDTAAAEDAILESLRHTSIRAGLTSDRLVTHSAIRLDAGDVEGSVDALVQCAKVSRGNSSVRLVDKIRTRRTALRVKAPNSTVVRGLDEKLTEFGIAI